MQKLLMFVLIFTLSLSNSFAQKKSKERKNSKVDYRIDNMGYWMKLAKQGVVPYNPSVKMGGVIQKGSKIHSKSVLTEDSPDIVLNSGDNTQTENSIYIDPNNNQHILNSNNSTDWTGSSVENVYGTSGLFTFDAGENWTGNQEGTGGNNHGDPATAIDLDGRMFVGNIKNSSMQQGVAYSIDNGETWTNVTAGNSSSLDKNHLWIDNAVTSPYKGNIYSAWTDFSFPNPPVEVVRSIDHGLTWSPPQVISNSPFDHGVNIQTDGDGNVYLIWAEYNNWPDPEDAISMSKSTDGGLNWSPSFEIITNIKGTRNNYPLAHRTNSFPVMAIDVNNGNIYVVWANYGVPGTNSGNWVNTYMIKSVDAGTTWSNPVQVSQSPNINGKFSYLPWITCDSETGQLAVIFLDNRDCTGDDVEAWVAVSMDEGDTWEDFKVSDISWTTKGIPGLADRYMGDYLGITSSESVFYPVWSDDRDGVFRAYTSPFVTNNRAKPTNLNVILTNDETGQTDLTWSYTDTKTLQHFVIYRNNIEIGTSNITSFSDILPTYGTYSYRVTAMHNDGESAPTKKIIQWGYPNISVSPISLTETLLINQTSTKFLTISNIGELDLTYNISTEITSKEINSKAYCDAINTDGDEYISGVVFGSINNTGTAADGYTDYTDMSTDIGAGNTYPITITNGNPYEGDRLGIWIDWNQDEDFDDIGERVICDQENEGQGTFDVSVPSDALRGQTRMRVRISYSVFECGSPCGTTDYGEVEDYSVNVSSWLKVENIDGIILPDKTENIPVKFNSIDLAEGTYNANIKIKSNDEDEPIITVPITLEVVGSVALSTDPYADDATVCNGSSTTLHANTVGGSGTYTYSWTSSPAGFSSEDENPDISPTITTIYTVVVDDGIDNVSNSIEITVSELPDVTLASFSDIHVNESAFTLTGGIPVGGIYSGAGVSDGMFDPAVAGEGTHIITYTYSDENDCENSAQQSIFVDEAIGIKDIVEDVKIILYPNPVNETLFLGVNTSKILDLNVKIVNQIGMIVLNKDIFVNKNSKSEFDLSEFSSGIYFITIKNEKINITRRVVVQ